MSFALQSVRGRGHFDSRLGGIRNSSHLRLAGENRSLSSEAATDLGDGPVKRFFGITLPLSLPGVIAATLMIFIPTVGDFVTPALVGGPDGLMIANIIQVQFGKVNNWPRGAALALTMMVTITTVSLVYIWVTRKLTGRIS